MKVFEFVVVACFVLGAAQSLRSQDLLPPAWVRGDVFVGIGNNHIEVYHNIGTANTPAYHLTQTLDQNLTPDGETTGCALDSASNLYTTNFQNNAVVKFDASSHTIAQTLTTGSTHNESIVFAARGDFFVGHADGLGQIERYNAAGQLQHSYPVAPDVRGSDWIDLSSDQHTIFYTSEGTKIKRFDVSANSGAGAQLLDFATISGSGTLFALRLLPPGDGSGGLLVADKLDIKRLDKNGGVVQTYDANINEITSEDFWFALNLDPDGTSFWAGAYDTGVLYKFDIATGNILTTIQTGATGTVPQTLAGVCLKGEPAAVNTVNLTFPTGTTTQTANYNPTDAANHHSWKAKVNATQPFTIAVSANETECGNGCPSGIANDPSDFQCRFKEYFSVSLSGDLLLPKPVPYSHGKCVFYRVENPPPDTDIAADILFTVGYNDPGPPPLFPGPPPFFCESQGGVTRFFRDPSQPPPPDAADNHSFAIDFTTAFNPTGSPGDPTISGDITKTFNDYVVACRFAPPSGTAMFLKPKAGTTYKNGSAIPFSVQVKDLISGAFITDAATFPNAIPLTIFQVGSNGVQTQVPTFGNPGGSPGYWTYDTSTNSYTAIAKTPKGLSPGSYSACVNSVRNLDGSTIPTPAPYFPQTCVNFMIK